jgi:hypothetical protein
VSGWPGAPMARTVATEPTGKLLKRIGPAEPTPASDTLGSAHAAADSEGMARVFMTAV